MQEKKPQNTEAINPKILYSLMYQVGLSSGFQVQTEAHNTSPADVFL